MSRRFARESLGWGFILWLIGYVLGIILVALVRPSLIGWIILPIGVVVTIWVVARKVTASSLHQFVLLGLVWTMIAILLDYVFIIKLFHPADGYYKADVYLYYLLTAGIPVAVGLVRSRHGESFRTSGEKGLPLAR